MGGGGDFQARVAAWLMTHMLAEEESEPPFALTAPLASVACETAGPVDDVVAGTVDGYAAYLQTKRTVTLEKTRTDKKGKLKPLPSAVDQFVRQFLQRRDAARNGQGDPLNPSHDRLVLGVGEGAPDTVKETLRGVLERIRIQPAGTPLRGSGLNQAECGALDTLLVHVRASWAACAGTDPTDAEVHEFLRVVRVEVVAVEGGQPAEREAKTMLRTSVLEGPNQAEQAWTALVRIGARLITTGSTIGRHGLVGELLLAKIRLRAPRSCREDIKRLKTRSDENSARLEEFSHIDLAGTRVQISRAYTQTVRAAAEDGPLLIVGRPGVGKSGVTHEVVEGLRREGRDVLVLAAQNISAASLASLRADLGLAHDLPEVLANWPGSDPAFLVVDALDASRDESARRTLLELIRIVIRSPGRWHVVASVREYDLRYGIDLRDLFVGDPPTGPAPSLPGSEMRRVRHLVISDLTDDELTQIGAQSIPLQGLIVSAPPPLHELLRNPFNLGLAARLLEAGADPEAIRALRTQMGLLDAYWERRVIGAVIRCAVRGDGRCSDVSRNPWSNGVACVWTGTSPPRRRKALHSAIC